MASLPLVALLFALPPFDLALSLKGWRGVTTCSWRGTGLLALPWGDGTCSLGSWGGLGALVLPLRAALVVVGDAGALADLAGRHAQGRPGAVL